MNGSLRCSGEFNGGDLCMGLGPCELLRLVNMETTKQVYGLGYGWGSPAASECFF